MVTKFKAKCLPRWSAGSSVRLVFSDLHDAISTLHIVSQSTSQQTTQPNNQLTNEPTTTPPIATTITLHCHVCLSIYDEYNKYKWGDWHDRPTDPQTNKPKQSCHNGCCSLYLLLVEWKEELKEKKSHARKTQCTFWDYLYIIASIVISFTLVELKAFVAFHRYFCFMLLLAIGFCKPDNLVTQTTRCFHIFYTKRTMWKEDRHTQKKTIYQTDYLPTELLIYPPPQPNAV